MEQKYNCGQYLKMPLILAQLISLHSPAKKIEFPGKHTTYTMYKGIGIIIAMHTLYKVYVSFTCMHSLATTHTPNNPWIAIESKNVDGKFEVTVFDMLTEERKISFAAGEHRRYFCFIF